MRWFLGDDVFGKYYGAWWRTANEYIATGGDLKATITELFNLQYFNQIAPDRYNKVRRPLNLVIAFLRATGARQSPSSPEANRWLEQLAAMSQLPGYRPSPDGYPEENDPWLGTMLPRLEFLYEACFNENGLNLRAAQLDVIFPPSLTVGELADKANKYVFGGGLPNSEENAIQAYLDGMTASLEDIKRTALFLTFASPSYQYLY